MKEDILEQIAEDYFLSQAGYFTKSNVKFRPDPTRKGYLAKTDSVHSDIDIVAFYTKTTNEISVVNCKSWQGGLNFKNFKNEINKAISTSPPKTIGKRAFWSHFRELCIEKWCDGFIKKIREELNSTDKITINYTILCTKITNYKGLNLSSEIGSLETNIDSFFNKIDSSINLKFDIITIDKYVNFVLSGIRTKVTPAVENTHLSRTFQLLLASDHKIVKSNLLTFKSFNPYNCSKCGFSFTAKDKKYYCPEDWYKTKEIFCKNCYINVLKKPKCSCGNKLKRV